MNEHQVGTCFNSITESDEIELRTKMSDEREQNSPASRDLWLSSMNVILIAQRSII